MNDLDDLLGLWNDVVGNGRVLAISSQQAKLFVVPSSPSNRPGQK